MSNAPNYTVKYLKILNFLYSPCYKAQTMFVKKTQNMFVNGMLEKTLRREPPFTKASLSLGKPSVDSLHLCYYVEI